MGGRILLLRFNVFMQRCDGFSRSRCDSDKEFGEGVFFRVFPVSAKRGGDLKKTGKRFFLRVYCTIFANGANGGNGMDVGVGMSHRIKE